VEKKMVVAPKSKLMWLQKVVPNAMSSQASQDEVVVGWQDLKRENKCGVDITPPIIEEPPMLRTTLFKGGG
jgi:hypothetical protein